MSRSGPLTTADDAVRTLVRVPGNHLMTDLLGPRDEVLDLVADAFPRTSISVRGNEISVRGPESDRVGRLFEELVVLVERGHRLEDAAVRRTIDMINADERPSEVLSTELLRTFRGGPVRPKTSGQKRYVDAIARHTVTFGVGPAGTGKSWLAVAMAVQALQAKQVQRIVLTRPAVEAGERLGFLPGDLMAKVDPYLRPLYDALHDMVGTENAQRLLERGTVEVAPLAFMRGRTLNDSFIILDEAQNTSPEQMKMFLTRIGFGSKAVVTGDVTQVDVPGGRSGLARIEDILTGIDSLAFVASDGPGRGAPQDRAGHRRRVRPPRRAGGTSAAMSSPAVVTSDDRDDASRHDLPIRLDELAELMSAVLSAEGAADGAEASLSLVDGERIAELKVEYLDGDGQPTDVLAFPIDGIGADLSAGDEHALVGDVVICPAVAQDQAPTHAGALEDELALLVVHGSLHLCGWDHATPSEQSRMWARERELLAQFDRLPPRDPWADAPDEATT